MIRDAARRGATLVCTPEVTNCISTSRAHRDAVLRPEQDDQTLEELRRVASECDIWIALGSCSVKTDDADGRLANRSFLIGPDGSIAARYDKMHMFDVTVSETERYRESNAYRPGDAAVLAQTPIGRIGLTICYDLRFPQLFRAYGQAGAEIILVPSAFSPVTGAAHWESLLRARAIETGCFVIAAAQTGTHPDSSGTSRETYGHSLFVSPWGEVLLDAGTRPGVHLVEIDVAEVQKVRSRIPALTHDVSFTGP